MARFDDCLAVVLKFEGGYSNNAADPGGATNEGITQDTYDAYRAAQGQPVQPVRFITTAEAGAIYGSRYWEPMMCAKLAQPVDLCVFDAGVNMGCAGSVRILQGALGVDDDGDMGPVTLAAANAADAPTLAAQLLDSREASYRQIVAERPASIIFLEGWLNRVNQLRTICGVSG